MFIRVTDSDALWIPNPGDLPLSLENPSPLPEGWTHTNLGWDEVITCPECRKGMTLEIWQVKRLV